MTSKQGKIIMMTAIAALVIILDQGLKLYVHSHLEIFQSIEITPWFHLCYVENNGMAFGVEWFSKLALTLFRIVAVIGIVWYMAKLVRIGWRSSYLAMLALTAAGALGNIIDCMFYGIIWDYAPFMYGRVIDMLYFPLIHDAQGNVLFFQPVFNIADTAITSAIFAILLFFRKDFNESFDRIKAEGRKSNNESKKSEAEDPETENSENAENSEA